MNNNQNYIEASCVRLNAEDLLSQLADSVKVEVTGRHLVYKFDPLKETAVEALYHYMKAANVFSLLGYGIDF